MRMHAAAGARAMNKLMRLKVTELSWTLNDIRFSFRDWERLISVQTTPDMQMKHGADRWTLTWPMYKQRQDTREPAHYYISQ